MNHLIAIVMVASAVVAQCPAADNLCSKCNGSTCAACINSYPDVFGKCIEVPSSKVPNCYHYYQSGKCLICASGYMRNEDFECSKIPIDNCLVANAAGQCAVCNNTIRVTNSTCNTTVRCGIPNCARCYQDDSCYECGPGYFLDYNGKCVLNNELIQDCRNVDVKGNCVICKENYYDMNGKCFAAKNAKILGVISAIVVLISTFAS